MYLLFVFTDGDPHQEDLRWRSVRIHNPRWCQGILLPVWKGRFCATTASSILFRYGKIRESKVNHSTTTSATILRSFNWEYVTIYVPFSITKKQWREFVYHFMLSIRVCAKQRHLHYYISVLGIHISHLKMWIIIFAHWEGRFCWTFSATQ